MRVCATNQDVSRNRDRRGYLTADHLKTINQLTHRKDVLTSTCPVCKATFKTWRTSDANETSVAILDYYRGCLH